MLSRKIALSLISIILSAGLLLLMNNCSPKSSGETPAVAFSCDSTPVAKGSRTFGMDILDVGTGGYAANVTNLKELGGDFQTLHLNWNQIEGAGSGATSGAFTDPYGALAALNTYAVTEGIKVTLRIHPADIPGKYVPSDLMNTRFNDANLKARAKAMIDYVFTKIQPSNVTRLMMGNELTGFNPGADFNFWYDYPDFLFEMNAYLNANYPTVELGFVITSDGAVDSSIILPNSGGQTAVAIFSAWSAAVDTVGVTYYPLNTDFTVKDNLLVAAHLNALAAFGSVPIQLEEVGYPSSTTSGASEDTQARFFCEVFKAWDANNVKFESMSILRMMDKTRVDAESVATTYGLTGNEKFIEFIRTLGIVSNGGTKKSSFDIIKAELQKRGW